MRGASKAPPLPGKREIALAFLGSFLAIGCIALVHEPMLKATGLPLAIAPFGASAVLVFGAFRSPLAQPRNVIGGHVLSGLVGVTVYQLVGDAQVAAVSLAVPAAIALMHISGALHPPGGATAFVTAAGGGFRAHPRLLVCAVPVPSRQRAACRLRAALQQHSRKTAVPAVLVEAFPAGGKPEPARGVCSAALPGRAPGRPLRPPGGTALRALCQRAGTADMIMVRNRLCMRLYTARKLRSQAGGIFFSVQPV